jgi:hypothetical protein
LRAARAVARETSAEQLKRRWRARLQALRSRLVLTPKEKRVITFIFAAFLLGLCAKHYRETHPHMLPQIEQKHPWQKYQAPSSSPSPKQKRQRKTPLPKAKPLRTSEPVEEETRILG